ncbi:MAG: patatin-like phospholipase family protein [Burkholderiales bacterium]|nr:patatin-like phospholipase family protein [Burkholderiales bacterium]
MFKLHRRPPLPALGLALQGGGAHGAFTWGVLDALLEAGDLRITGLSGASAGALNAVALADGFTRGGPDGARESLALLWTQVAAGAPLDGWLAGSPEAPTLAPPAQWALQWTRLLSPGQWNPLQINPLRNLLAQQIDFERLRRECRLKLYLSATHANSGRLRLFGAEELSLDVLMASTCLPTLHAAVEIDGEPYWDGGYSANPPLLPLVTEAQVDDLLIVVLDPLSHGETPHNVEQIRSRAVEIAFSGPFLREAALLGELQQRAQSSQRSPLRWWGRSGLEQQLRRSRVHLIDAQEALGHLSPQTRLLPHLPFLERLRDLGRERAQAWLAGEGQQLGRGSTVNLLERFGRIPPRG